MLRTSTLIAFLGFSLLYLTSYSGGPTGPGGDATGSPLTQTACTSCHNGGNFNPVTTISLLDQGTAVTAYEPGKTYTLQLSTTAENSPGGYGFQAVVMDAANANAGSFGTPPASFKISTSGGREFLEHSASQTSSSVEVEWTAPASGTGEVTVYVGGNAINTNGATSGDNANLVELSFAEGTASSTADMNASTAFNAYQRTESALALKLGEELAFPVHFTLQDLSGRILHSDVTSTPENSISFTNRASKIILVSIQDANGRSGAKQIALR